MYIWRNVYSNPLPIFMLGYLSLTVFLSKLIVKFLSIFCILHHLFFHWLIILLVSYLRNHCPIQDHEDLHLGYLLSLAFIFRSLIYFELIFIYDVNDGSKSSSLHVAIQLFQRHLLKRLFFFQ